MAQGIAEEIIDEIRQHTDLVVLVGEYLKLERRGKNMVGLCPFHNEKTPSFTVSPEKQLYHCFGCGASGNAFSLIMQMEKLTFPEAAKLLARRAGVKIPENRITSPARDQQKDKIYKLNLMATRYYAYHLKKTASGKKALNYLLKRGISERAIELFMLGYAPADWTGFFNFAQKKGASPELMVQAGLVSPGKEKGYYDRFRGRIIFPIYSISGKVAGFGGRAFDDNGKGGPKYLNSPETIVFSKGAMLYGLNLAREEIRKSKKAVVMEGYTDVITAYQAGIRNVVASLGTALTAEQCRLLRNQADTVITAYDSDTAGEAATWRGLVVLQSTGCLVHVADLPQGSDPDSMIREKGAEAFNKLIEDSIPLIEYRLQRLKERYDLNTESGRVRYTEELMPFLVAAVNQVEQDYYLKKAAEELGVEEGALRNELKKYRRSSNKYREEGKNDSSEEVKTIAIRPAEKILISLMLQSKEIAEQGRNLIKSDYIEDSLVKKVFDEIWNLYESGEVVSAEKLLNRFEDNELVRLVSMAATDPALQDLQPRIAKRMAEDSIEYLQRLWSAKQQRELKKKIKELESLGLNEEIEKLLREHQHLLTNKYGSPYRSGKGGDFNG
ncbi:MAG: DNA primase [Dethiobacteria bacterium]